MNDMNMPWLRLNPALKHQSFRFYLSRDSRIVLGPFTMAEIKWMIRCRHFSPEILIRGEHDAGWTSYRHYVSRCRTQRIVCTILTQLRRLGLISTADLAR